MRELGQTEQAPWEGVSDAAKREGLYEEHEVKGELVIGPDVLQPPDVAFAMRASKPKLNSGGWSNAETSKIIKPIAISANSECSLENSQNPDLTDICRNQNVDKSQHSTKTIQEEINPKMEMRNKENSHTSDKTLKCEVGSSQSSQNQYSTRPKRTRLVEKHSTCAWEVSEKNDFIDHNMKNLTGQQSFRCDICKKQFVSSKNLWNHKQMHAGDTPYSCDMCVKQFSHKSYLNIHKRIHETNKPHPCDVCGKQFMSKYQLNTHKQSHVVEKPYSCKNCKKQFAQNKYFIKHIWNCKK